MKILAFVIWMLGWPLVITIDQYLNHCEVSDTTAFFIILIWFSVGFLVYRKAGGK